MLPVNHHAERRRRASLRRQRVYLMVSLMALLWLYGLAYVFSSAALMDFVNAAGPLCIAVSFSYAAIKAAQFEGALLWTPYFWFLASAAAFFGVGPLAQVFGNADTLAYLDRTFRLSHSGLLATNVMNAAGLLVVIIGVHLVNRWLPMVERVGSRVRESGPTLRPASVAVAFLILGGLLEYAVILPVQLGVAKTIVPGSVFNLALLNVLGLTIAAYLAHGSRRWRALLWLLWPPQLLIAALLFDKTSLLLTLLLPPLGAFLAHREVRRIALWGLVALATYVVVQPAVLWARGQVLQNSGGGGASLERRLQVAETYLSGGGAASSGAPSVQMWWVRLDLAPEQGFVIRRRGAGLPAHTLDSLEYVWIPRLIWPEKPVTTDLGAKFYVLINDLSVSPQSHSGPGAFADGYWNFGWPGVFGFALAIGVTFAVLSRLSLRWIRSREFAFLPCILLAVQAGALGMSKFFATAIVGMLVIFAGYWGVVRLLIAVKATSGVRRVRKQAELHS